MVPDDLRYTAAHEWVRSNTDGTARVGITFFAQDALGDIVYVSLPAVGSRLEAEAACGEVESTKSVSEIYAPVAGEVVATNLDLDATPELVNTGPYEAGWMFDVRLDDPGAVDALLSAAEYRAITEQG